MKKNEIKVGHWYETKRGLGVCKRVGGTFPFSVEIQIVKPFPAGVLNLGPRDLIREIPAPTP